MMLAMDFLIDLTLKKGLECCQLHNPPGQVQVPLSPRFVSPGLESDGAETQHTLNSLTTQVNHLTASC